MEDLKKQLFNLAILYGLKNCYETLDSLRDTVRAHGQFLIEECNITVVKQEQIEQSTLVEESKMEEPTVEVLKVEEPVKLKKTKKKEMIDGEQPLKGNAKKRWQREQEALKRSELSGRGIFKADVLTVDNLRAWIESGRSYADIARSEVGCTEEEVSKFCKKHNIHHTQ